MRQVAIHAGGGGGGGVSASLGPLVLDELGGAFLFGAGGAGRVETLSGLLQLLCLDQRGGRNLVGLDPLNREG